MEIIDIIEVNPETGVMLAVIPAAVALVVLIVMGIIKKIKNK